MLTPRDEQLRRSVAWLEYARRRIVKLYPDFPARADRRKIPGHDTHNPQKA